MKNKLLLSLILTLAIAFAGYFGYQYFKKLQGADVWGLVPGNAILVYESSNTVKVWNELQFKAPWKSLLKVPYFEAMKSDFEGLDSLGGKSGQLDELLKGNPFLISMNVTGDDEFGFTYFLELKGLQSNTLAAGILDHFKSEPGNTFRSRKFRNFTIEEIRSDTQDKVFTYVNYKNFFIGSFTSQLVEDVIRNISDSETEPFVVENASAFEFSKLENDQGNIYINSDKLGPFLNVFVDKKGNSTLDQFSGNAFLDLNITDEAVLLNGFTSKGNSVYDHYLSTFTGQKSYPFGNLDFIPNRTSILFNITLSDGVKWKENLLAYWKANIPDQLERYVKIKSGYSFDGDEFFQWLGNEISLATLESVNPENNEKILIIQANDISKALNQLNRASETLSESGADSLYVESYSGMEIRELPITDFPESLLGSKFSGFTQTFYSAEGNHIMMSNNVQVIKNLIDERERENVWSKSVRQNRFLESLLDEANISLIVNTLSGWKSMMQLTGDKWKNLAQRHQGIWQQFENAGAQFTFTDDKFFTSITLDFIQKDPIDQRPQNYFLVQNVEADYEISTKPFVVKNHTNEKLETVFQDNVNNFYLVDMNGKILWKDSIGEQIQGEVYQIDYYKNDKLQYFFITEHGIHLIDRLGDYVEGFPVKLTEGLGMARGTVIDYDKSKRYRFLLADKEGNLYMYDKTGKNLEGWQPRRLRSRLASDPFHVRVRGKDCIVALQQDGVINIMNRRGEMYPGFPLDLKDRVENPLFTSIGTSFENSTFTTVTQSGLLISFNLEGRVVARKQLYRPSKDVEFRVATDALGNTFAISRQEHNRVSILDHNGDEIFEKDFIASGIMDLQFYNFGRGQQVFVLTDKEQEFTYMYDASGGLINYQPIESGHKIGLLYFETDNRFQVFKNYQEYFSILDYNR